MTIYNIAQYKLKKLHLCSLDFYLPDFNVAIECQGKQHFEPIEFFGGEDKFLKQLRRDKKKFDYCKDHNIKLLYYSNLDYDGMIHSLDELLTKIKS